ncbi:hypothetical protein CL634_03020 [bacterium]|nr:hypothetical protein [bacterium]|tara:strand:- start:256 stop:597 length:342 start_codon:yes stop_codon:yes gene_type:complete
MNILNNHVKQKIKEHSLNETPRECCGLILDIGGEIEVLRCKNVAKDNKKNFRIDEIDYLNASKRGSIKAYYHSHPHDEVGRFSGADAQVSRAQNIPLIMYSIFHDNFYQLDHE